MRLAALVVVGVIALGACRDAARSGSPPVVLRERPAATVEVTLKALGVT